MWGERAHRPISRRASALQHPAPLFEDPIGACVELTRRLRHRQIAVDDALRDQSYLVGDSLPLGNLRRRLDALELLAKRACMNIFSERAGGPRAAPRRQIAGQVMKALLHRGLR